MSAKKHRLPPFRAVLPKFFAEKRLRLVMITLLVLMVGIGMWQTYQLELQQRQARELAAKLAQTESTLEQVETELETLQNEDPYKTNQELQARITQVEETYTSAVSVYETLDDLEQQEYDQDELTALKEQFALTLNQLAEQNYEAATETLAAIDTSISELRAERARELAAATQQAAESQAQNPAADTPPTAAVSNELPSHGYRRQVVQTDIGQYTVSIVAGDLSSTRVIVDTASAQDCATDCPVLSLGDYVSRNGGYAGINGTYFCPASYPSCAGKTNSFDLLVMNKDKTYFNSANNVYSTNPGVIFNGSSIRFVGQISQWGRDTSVDGVLSNYPLLVSGSTVVFGGDGDPKKGSIGNRSFVANRGSTVYIGVVHGATVAESARALQAMGVENALNLDSGGSTALWFGGYKVGPGRAIPNAIIFVQR